MKKYLAILLALAMVFALCACGSSAPASSGSEPAASGSTASEAPAATGGSELAGTYDITVWCPDAAVDLTKKQIADFNASNEFGIVFNATVENVGEGDAASQMITDVEAGADIYNFASDQFARLVQANALAKLGVAAADKVRSSCDEGAVGAATMGGEIYAYPLTADNCFFMYYDKSVIPEDAVGSMDAIIKACEDSNKFFAFDLGNGWYVASFFFATGCTSSWWTDADGHWNFDDDINSDKGLAAMKALNVVENSPMFLSKSSAAEFDSGAAMVVSGTWDSNAAKEILGENFGAAPLPSITVDGTDYALRPFLGYKFMGVKPQTDAVKAAALHQLAQYLTGEAAETERFEAVGWGPANNAAKASDAVKNDDVMAAVAAQSNVAVNQGQIPDGWWNVAAALGTAAKESGEEDALKAALATYADGIEKLKNLREGLLFVGAWNGWNNTDESDTYVLTGDGDVKTLTLEVPESDYMGGRIVNIGSWDNDKGFAQVTAGADLIKDLGADNPDNNIVFAAAGTYTVSINTASGEITITAG